MILICFVCYKFCYCFVIAVFVIVGMEMERKGLRISDFAPILYSANWIIPQELSQCLTREFSSWKRSHFEFSQPFTKCISPKKLRSNNLIMFYYRKLLFFHKVGVLCTPKRCWSCWLVLFLFNVSLFSKNIGFQVTPLWYKRFRIVRV